MPREDDLAFKTGRFFSYAISSWSVVVACQRTTTVYSVRLIYHETGFLYILFNDDKSDTRLHSIQK